MSGNEELFKALQGFGQGAKELSMVLAFRGANNDVQKIKRSELSDQEKQTALYGIADNVVGRMAMLGLPADKLDSISRALGAPHLDSANKMEAYGLETGNSAVQSIAQTQQNFEQNPANKIALINAKAAANGPVQQELAKQKRDEFTVTKFESASKEIDKSRASSRSAFGIAGITGQNAERMKALIGSPDNIKNAGPAEATLIAEGMAKLVKGGVATREELKALVGKTSGNTYADVMQYFTNTPVGAKREGFTQRYLDIVNREQELANKQSVDIVLNRATGLKKTWDRAPDQAKEVIAAHLKTAYPGKDFSAEDINLPTKAGRITLTEAAQRKHGKQVKVRDKKTGQVIDAIQGLDGKIYTQ
jgi:hypothetical protein